MARLLTNRSPAYRQTDTQNRKFQRATRTSPTFSEIKSNLQLEIIKIYSYSYLLIAT